MNRSRQFFQSLSSSSKIVTVATLLLGLGLGNAWAQADAAKARTSPVDTRIVPEFTPLNQSGAASPGIKSTPGGIDANDGNLPVPSTIGDDYKIAPNDLLEVEVFNVKELKRTVRVNSSGYVALPLIGQLQLGGYTASDAEALVALAYGKKYLQDPQVSIFIKEFTTQRITLDGALTKPGIYPINGQITLLRALALAGGSAPMADMENVMLFRLTPDGQTLSEKYDVEKIRKGEAKDPLLQGDDVVVVNRDSRRTALRDSLFRDIIDTLNPFSASVNQMGR
ncbi:polysaccharide biosynthesis/export family protein [Piscinibacter sakaiensis]|uniref:polysaccharide biosynthesis/export family protein n=1 Tax=Piscinibacter sakaiensis TaxID=1547922 RepID=UPI003AB09B51